MKSPTNLVATALLFTSIQAIGDEPDAQGTMAPGVVVTATRYSAPTASSATKSDAPLMETPVSVQVVSQQVLADQQVTRLAEAVSNVSGIYTNNIFFGQFADDFTIRGFRSGEVVYRDGFRVDSLSGKRDLANVEQVEIVKGPASVLYGRMEPGGMVNYITKKPLASAQYSIGQQLGSFSNRRTTLDVTGPLASGPALNYRLNVGYEDSESFRDFVASKRLLIAPSIEWVIGPKARLLIDYEYFDNHTTPDNIGAVAFGDRPLELPRERNLAEPTDFQNAINDRIGLNFSYGLGDRWRIAVELAKSTNEERDGGAFGDFVTDADIVAGVLPRAAEGSQTGLAEYGTDKVSSAAVNLAGSFATGKWRHDVLIGTDYRHTNSDYVCCGINGEMLDDIDIFNPVYGQTLGPVEFFDYSSSSSSDWTGAFVQDQMELPGRVHVLAGARYDRATDHSFGTASTTDSRTSPRIGVLWRPRDFVALYASYVENFGASNAGSIDRNDQPLKPETAQQTELGIKTEWLSGRLSATLALYELTKQSIATADPLYPDPGSPHALAVGEARSRGVEFDLAGELGHGWNMIANYAYTKTRILNDSFLGVAGNEMPNAPQHGGRVWSTYRPVEGVLRGWMFGGGVTARSMRQGNLDNDFQLPGYATVDLVGAYSFALGAARVNVQANVDNVFDRSYFEASGDCCRSRILWGTPRSVMVSANVTFR